MLSSPPTLQSSVYQRYVNSIGAIDQSGCSGAGGGGANTQRPRVAIFGHKHVIYLLNMIGPLRVLSLGLVLMHDLLRFLLVCGWVGWVGECG